MIFCQVWPSSGWTSRLTWGQWYCLVISSVTYDYSYGTPSSDSLLIFGCDFPPAWRLTQWPRFGIKLWGLSYRINHQVSSNHLSELKVIQLNDVMTHETENWTMKNEITFWIFKLLSAFKIWQARGGLN